MGRAKPAEINVEAARSRVAITAVRPDVERGRYPIKRTVGERVDVEADIITDGHDAIAAVLRHRAASEREWRESRLKLTVNDLWVGGFSIDKLEPHLYTVTAWIDHFETWRRDLKKRIAAGQDIGVDLTIGAALIEETVQRAAKGDAERMKGVIRALRGGGDQQQAVSSALDDEFAEVMHRADARRFATDYEVELRVDVDPRYACFGAWYEMFPRSCAEKPGAHGTLADCVRLLPYVESMGFDILYLPPIHPIGRQFRKGKNNATKAGPEDVGSPWAIGAAEGGHKAIHPNLGTAEDFRRLVSTARERGIEVSLDIAYQCAPDHPYVKEHPEWFLHRPDGSIQYAENPPKKYQDIYPFNFECEEWKSLWEELRSVVLHWIGEGVRIFRVDNPHTKCLRFWEWMIGTVRREHPEAIFLAEAFTRPKMMHQLAKIGFNQSYTYFAWRNAKWELEQYFNELTTAPQVDFMRANVWPNTPDILTEYLQVGGKPAFVSRLVLAATLGASYGIYGPTFELCENRAREHGSEEYLDSEKYQIRHWNREHPDSLRHLIARVNQIRREHVALQSYRGVRFLKMDNEQLIAYLRTAPGQEPLLICVNLDPHHTQSGWVHLPEEIGPVAEPCQAHDLLSGARYIWNGDHAYIELNPQVVPAHVFQLRRRVRSEHDFEYYL